MQRRELTCLLLTALAGCQSGRPERVLFNDTRNVIAYRDQYYPGLVYVADAQGTWAVGEGAAMLSGDGKYLLLIRSRKAQDAEFTEGTPFMLYDVQRRVRHVGVTPRRMSRDETNVFFEDGPRLTLEVESGSCWSWKPGETWQESERPSSAAQRGFSGEDDESSQAFEDWSIVVLGPDGWNARRTVWVRRDGSAVELLRQNDRPLFYVITLARTPIELILMRDDMFMLNWFRFEEWRPLPGEKTVADLRGVIERQRAAASRPTKN